MPSSATEPSPLRIGVDVGGTFTDLVSFDPDTGRLGVVKLPSTPPDFHLAVIEAVGRAAGPTRTAQIVHGSTVATNALLQRSGEPCAFVTTEGFRDMLLIGRQNRPDLYALQVSRPAPLTPEANWLTVRERIGATGDVVEPLRNADVDRLIGEIQSRGLRHVAVCLLFSFINPAHEQQIGRRCAAAGLTVSLSSDILPEFREYERASTTVINASLRPTVQAYLQTLAAGLAGRGEDAGRAVGDAGTRGREDAGRAVGDAGTRGREDAGNGGRDTRTGEHHEAEVEIEAPPISFPASPRPRVPASSPLPSPRLRVPASPPALSASSSTMRIMHSGGGTLSVEDAARSAARLVLSGPAGGVLGASFMAEAAGAADVITYDMGGTSTDVAVILEGRPQWTTSSTVEGLPIGLSAMDIHTVGAGGGSIAYIDAGGALRVGPRSAGAFPGPACYGRGGTEPTVTDANLLLGRILPDQFAGGSMRVDPGLALKSIEPLARAMGKSPVEAALGIVRVAENNMSRAVRAVTSRRGLDPREFALLSFGGAGGLHACALADSLDIPRVLVPPYCGVLSALGMVVAPPVFDASKTVVHLADQLDDDRLAAEYGSLSGQTMDVIPFDQTGAVEVYADVRFRGQSHELMVRVERPAMEHIHERFVEAYRARYGQTPGERPIEIVTLRVRRLGRRPSVRLPELEHDTSVSPIDRRRVILPDGSPHAAPALPRARLRAAGITTGPLLMIDPEATTFVPPNWSVHVLENGSLMLASA